MKVTVLNSTNICVNHSSASKYKYVKGIATQKEVHTMHSSKLSNVTLLLVIKSLNGFSGFAYINDQDIPYTPR